MRIYLDVCCLNRPLDDLSVGRNKLEAEAVMEILRRVQNEVWELVGSQVVDAELSLIPSPERRIKAMELAQLRSSRIDAGQGERSRAVELLSLGLRYMDALHVACAESSQCDVFLTTDDKLLAKAQAYEERIMVKVGNPLAWIIEVDLQ